MKKIITLPTILGVAILVVGILAGVYLIENRIIFRPGASGETAPKDVRFTNITDSSLTVSWVTDVPTVGFVKYGTSQSSLVKQEQDETSGSSTTHLVTVQNLEANSRIFFKINSDGYDFDFNGAPWQVTTGAFLGGSPKETVTLAGVIQNSSGAPIANALVYVQLAGASPLSTTTSASGNYLVTISFARNIDLSSYQAIGLNSSRVDIAIVGGDLGVASAQVLAGIRQVPPIIIGQTHDFTNLPSQGDMEVPDATIDLPQDDSSTDAGGLKIEDLTTALEVGNLVTLESHEEGELITTTAPEFFGEGPAGTSITIIVESEPITQTIKIGSNGAWSWNPPTDLPEGNHTITISYKDAGGILRQIKRSFIVVAAEGPAFESTPSATTSPKPTPIPTPTPTATPSATPSPPIPVSGSLTPTFTLLIMGLGVLILSFIIFTFD